MKTNLVKNAVLGLLLIMLCCCKKTPEESLKNKMIGSWKAEQYTFKTYDQSRKLVSELTNPASSGDSKQFNADGSVNSTNNIGIKNESFVVLSEDSFELRADGTSSLCKVIEISENKFVFTIIGTLRDQQYHDEVTHYMVRK